MTTELPSGNELIEENGKRILIIWNGGGMLGFGAEILENEFAKDTDDWINREIEIHQIIKKYS